MVFVMIVAYIWGSLIN